MHTEKEVTIKIRKRWANVVLKGFSGMPLDEMHVDTMQAVVIANRIAQDQEVSTEELMEFMEFMLNLPTVIEVLDAHQ